jgi:hypothetical protein
MTVEKANKTKRKIQTNKNSKGSKERLRKNEYVKEEKELKKNMKNKPI